VGRGPSLSTRVGIGAASSSNIPQKEASLTRWIPALALGALLFAGNAFGACISKWSQIDQLSERLPGLDIDQIQSSGAVKFRLVGKDKVFTLSKYQDRIYAETPEGNAYVSLCAERSGLKAVANLGLLGKKEAHIEALGSGNFKIKTDSNIYRASVVR